MAMAALNPLIHQLPRVRLSPVGRNQTSYQLALDEILQGAPDMPPRGAFSRKGRAVALTMLLLTAVGRTAAPAEDAGAQWVRDAVVIVSTGSDALGGRVPGSWFAHSGSQIAVSGERAFTGKSSLEIHGPTHPAFKLLDDPIAREFVRAQYIAGKSFIADIAASIREDAAEQNRVVPFFGNQGAAWGGNRFPVFSVIISGVVDAQCLEDFLLEPYNCTSRTAWSALQYKLMRAVSLGRKPVWPLLDTGKFRKWPTGARLFPARALSQGAVPLLMWSPTAWPDEATYRAHANYARFLNANRALFLNRQPVARVALVYSVPTCFWRYFHTYWIYWRAGSNHGKSHLAGYAAVGSGLQAPRRDCFVPRAVGALLCHRGPHNRQRTDRSEPGRYSTPEPRPGTRGRARRTCARRGSPRCPRGGRTSLPGTTIRRGGGEGENGRASQRGDSEARE